MVINSKRLSGFIPRVYDVKSGNPTLKTHYIYIIKYIIFINNP